MHKPESWRLGSFGFDFFVPYGDTNNAHSFTGILGTYGSQRPQSHI